MALKGGKGMRLLPADQGIGPAAAAAAVSRQAWLLPSRQLLRWAGLTGGSSRSAAAAAATGTGSSGGSSSSGAKPKAVAERIGFVGAGQMGEALIRGFIKVCEQGCVEGVQLNAALQPIPLQCCTQSRAQSSGPG